MNISEFEKHKNDFLHHIKTERNLSEHTCKAYCGDLNQFVKFWVVLPDDAKKHVTLRLIIERFLSTLFYKKIHKGSIARKFSCFTSFSKFLETRGIKLDLDVKRPHFDIKSPRYLTVEEIIQLLDNTADDALPTKYPLRDKAIFELLYATGVRCSELAGIRIRDIDMESRTILIRHGRKERIVLFGNKAHEKIVRYCNTERTTINNRDEALFLTCRIEQLTSRTVQRIIRMFREFLSVDRQLTPYTLRHSFATHLLREGANLGDVQQLLGHASSTTTEKYIELVAQENSRIATKPHD